MRDYGQPIISAFLVSMRSTTDPCLSCDRLYQHTISGHAGCHNTTSIHDRIRFCYHPELCLQSCNADNQNRDYHHLDKQGQYSPSGCLGFRVFGNIHFRHACKRGCLPVHLHPARNIHVPLHNSSFHDGHDYRAVIINLFPDN